MAEVADHAQPAGQGQGAPDPHVADVGGVVRLTVGLLFLTKVQSSSIWTWVTYGSLAFTAGIGNPRATVSYKSGGSPQSSRRRVCTSVNGDNMACVCPLTSTILTLIVFIVLSSNSAPGRAVWRPG